MPITFQRCHVYNKVFFCNLNELAFVHPLLSHYLWGFLAFSKSWVVARQNSLTDLLIIHSLIDYLSGGFESFCKTNCNSSNDTLDRSKVYVFLTKGF
jgi:hypothetical protein